MFGFFHVFTLFVSASCFGWLHCISANQTLPFPHQPDYHELGWAPFLQQFQVYIPPAKGQIFQYNVYHNTSCPDVCCDSAQEGKMMCEHNSYDEGQSSRIPPSNSCVTMNVTLAEHVGYFFSNITIDFCNKSKLTKLIPNNPKPIAFGWRYPYLVKVTMNAIPISGLVQYDLLFDRTCPTQWSNLPQLNWCRRVINQSTCHSVSNWNCTICNSTEDCTSKGFLRDHDICFVQKMTASLGVMYTELKELNYRDVLILLPPRNVRLIATAKRTLTVYWDSPPGFDNATLQNTIKYGVILKNDSGSCAHNTAIKYATGQIWNLSYSFEGLEAWSLYSVTLCSAIEDMSIDETLCICGTRNVLSQPVSQYTLPEAPSEPPIREPCEASCVGDYMNVTLEWQASEGQQWNGIPTKSIIRIWNVSLSNIRSDGENNLGSPVLVLSIPLERNYSGAMVSYTINGLDSSVTYQMNMQFCTTGGCGENTSLGTIHCEGCGSIEDLENPTKHSPSEDTISLGTAIGIGVPAAVIFCVILIVVVCRWKTVQRRNRPPTLQDRIGNLVPSPNYDEPNSPNMTSEDGLYSTIHTDGSPLMENYDGASNNSQQWV